MLFYRAHIIPRTVMSNCLFAALYLSWRLRSLRWRVLFLCGIIPHFQVVDHKGRRWEFEAYYHDESVLWYHGHYMVLKPRRRAACRPQLVPS